MKSSRSTLVLVVFSSLLSGCASTPAPHEQAEAMGTSPQPLVLGHELTVRQLAEGVWLHESAKEMPGYGRVPSNGLVLLGTDGAVLVDTPWTQEQTKTLVDWIEHSLQRRLAEVIVTHSHEDRTGGVAAIPQSARILSLATTAQLSADLGRAFPAEALPPTASLELAGVRFETFFPGAGHAPDNLVVWLADQRLLFGGCFVKSGESKTLGNVADADLASWRAAVQRVRERYPQAVLVVPGHGAPGGPELLSHTGELLKIGTPQAE